MIFETHSFPDTLPLNLLASSLLSHSPWPPLFVEHPNANCFLWCPAPSLIFSTFGSSPHTFFLQLIVILLIDLSRMPIPLRPLMNPSPIPLPILKDWNVWTRDREVSLRLCPLKISSFPLLFPSNIRSLFPGTSSSFGAIVADLFFGSMCNFF